MVAGYDHIADVGNMVVSVVFPCKMLLLIPTMVVMGVMNILTVSIVT